MSAEPERLRGGHLLVPGAHGRLARIMLAAPRPATALTDDEIARELDDLEARWKTSRRGDDEGHGGSPGEWIVERMDELETEQKRRGGHQ